MAGLQDILLAGIGAMSITGEKAKETVDKLIEQGQISLEQGKQLNEELQHKATGAAKEAADKAGAAATEAAAKAAGFVSPIEELSIETRMRTMTPEARAAFVAKIQEIAAKIEAEAEAAPAEAEVVEETPEA